jgi:hypothetical protein
MGSATIKVIKKSSGALRPDAKNEQTNVKSFTKKAVHNIEGNIKNWIEELQIRKNDELCQAHSLLSGI